MNTNVHGQNRDDPQSGMQRPTAKEPGWPQRHPWMVVLLSAVFVAVVLVWASWTDWGWFDIGRVGTAGEWYAGVIGAGVLAWAVTEPARQQRVARQNRREELVLQAAASAALVLQQSLLDHAEMRAVSLSKAASSINLVANLIDKEIIKQRLLTTALLLAAGPRMVTEENQWILPQTLTYYGQAAHAILVSIIAGSPLPLWEAIRDDGDYPLTIEPLRQLPQPIKGTAVTDFLAEEVQRLWPPKNSSEGSGEAVDGTTASQ